MQENNWVITTKNGGGVLPLFHGNVEQLIPINAPWVNYCCRQSTEE